MMDADTDRTRDRDRADNVSLSPHGDEAAHRPILAEDARYAIYLTPSGPWDRVGSVWLGRDAATDAMLPRDWLDALSPDLFASAASHEKTQEAAPTLLDTWTSDPRRYGLHATLKPPFRLAPGQTVSALDGAMRTLAASMTPFALPLVLRTLRGFLAWQPADEAIARGPLQALADTCVRDLDGFRARPTEAERARRLEKAGGAAKRYDARETAHLERWGYPYVFDTFRFHITLTNRLDSVAEARACRALIALAHWAAATDGAPEIANIVSPHGAGMPVRDISLFIQPAPDQPFVIARHYGFDGTVRDATGAWALKENATDTHDRGGTERTG